MNRNQTQHRLPNTRWRGGTALLEVLIVLTVTVMMLTPILAMLHLLLGAERSTAKELRESLLLSRISEQFRRDVHAATDSRLFPEPPDRATGRLSLTFPDGRTIDYRHEAGRLTRIVTETGRTIQQDRFVFREGSLIRFSQDPKWHLIAITITRPRRSNSFVPRAATPAREGAVVNAAETKRDPQSPVAAPKPYRTDRGPVGRRVVPDDKPPRHVIRFEAVLGRDHRFQKKVAK